MDRLKTINSVDLFCGAGGTSEGTRQAAAANGYRMNLLAVNHSPVAIRTHKQNHPESTHRETGVEDVSPLSYHRDGIDHLWASPECTHHSRAAGGVPKNDQSRSGANCVLEWARLRRPPLIQLENVSEYVDHGPLHPADHPDPRLRLQPDKSKKGTLFQAWVAALRGMGYVVEWRVLCTADYGVPQERKRLILQAALPEFSEIIWPERTHWSLKEIAAGKAPPGAKPWVSARDAVIDYSLQGRYLDEMPPKARYGGLPLAPKTLKRILYGLAKEGIKLKGGTRSHPVTVDALITLRGTTEKALASTSRSPGEPLTTVAGSNRHVVADFESGYIIPIDNHSSGDKCRRSVEDPLTTVITEPRHGFVQPYLIPTAHSGDKRSRSCDAPMPTVAGTRGDLSLCDPQVYTLPQQSCGALRGEDRPVSTVATAGAIAAVSVEPVTVEALAYLIKYYGTGKSASLTNPIGTITTKDRFAILFPEVVFSDGTRIRVRLRWRMLQPHELAAAQGFPKDYVICGNKTESVKQIGNAVPPGLALAVFEPYLKAGRYDAWKANKLKAS